VKTVAARIITFFVLNLTMLSLQANNSLDAIKFRHFDNENRLGFMTVTDIQQDQLGYLWISGQNGVARFDGYQFKSMKKIPQQDRSLGDNFVWQMKPDENNGLWAVTRGGFSHFDTKTGSFSNYSRKTVANSTDPEITAVTIDSKSRLWLGTRSHGLQLFDANNKQAIPKQKAPGGLTKYINTLLADENGIWIGSGPALLRSQGTGNLSYFDFTTAAIEQIPLPFKAGVTKLIQTDDGIIWIATYGDGVWKFDRKTRTFIDSISLPNNKVNALLADHKNRLWIATSSGLYQYHNKQLNPVGINARSGDGPGNRVITALKKDSSGNLWIGTWTEGLYQMELFENGFKFMRANSNQNSISSNEVVSMTTTEDKELWVAIWRKGVDRFDPSGNKIGFYQHQPDNPHSLTKGNTRQVHIDHRKQLWIATSTGLNRYNKSTNNFTRFEYDRKDPKGLCGPWVIHLSSDINGLWIGTRGNGACFLGYDSNQFIHFAKKQAEIGVLSHNDISVIYSDFPRGVWIGTEGGGLNYFDAENKLTVYTKSNPAARISNNNITSIAKVNDNEFWIGTFDDGINIFKYKGSSKNPTLVKTISTLDGLASNSISYLIKSDKDTIWASSINGISKINTLNYEITEFEQKLSFLDGSGHKSQSGNLYFGGAKGLIYFNPNNIQYNNHIPPIVLTEFRLNNDIVTSTDENMPVEIELATEIIIPYQKNMFTVSYAALDFQAPDKNQYRHRLQGFDNNWINNSADRHFATYTNLPAGHYRLIIQGSNNDNIWNNEGRTLNVIVESSPWLSLWAIFGYSLITLLIFSYLIWEYRQRMQMNLTYNADLQDTEERLMMSLWGSGNELWDWDMASTETIRTNQLQLLVLPKHLLNGSIEGLKGYVHAKDIARLNRAYIEHLNSRKPMFECSYRIHNENGEWIWVLDKGKIVEWNEIGNPLRMSGTLENINTMKSTEERLNIIAKSLENTADGIWITDHKFNFVFVNNTYTTLTGIQEKSILNTEYHFSDIGNQNRTFEEYVKGYLLSDGRWKGEIWDKRENGEHFLQHLNIDSLRDENDNITHFIGVFSDITERKNSEKELYKLAKYDRLTSLLNASEFKIILKQHINVIESLENSKFALIFIGLDDFSTVNELLGLEAGDYVLTETANRIRRCFPKLETIARYSGDEYIILLPNSADNQLNKNLQKLRRILAEEYIYNNRTINITSSIGISLYPDHGTQAEQIFENSYTAMYRIKNSSGDNIQYFNESILSRKKISSQLENEIIEGINEQQFELYFQPRINLLNNKLTCIESLLRWNNPKRGLLTPGIFLPLAEQTGLIHKLGDWITQSAAESSYKFQEIIQKIPLSLRVSSEQLRQPFFAEKLVENLEAFSVDQTQIELIFNEAEITNARLTSKQNLDALNNLQIRISLTNFTTAESSLIWLQQQNITSLRVSRKLISQIDQNDTSKVMIKMLITLAKTLSIDCIADGVETEAQRLWLKQNGCQYATGYLFAKPMPIAAMTEYLLTQK
jgi:diguanylate cyclase (GGDEF)-like protein/PAS domain S-box-containing protein